MKRNDFFGADQHPRITFTMKRGETVDHDCSWTLYGDLAMNGISKELKLVME